MSDLLSNQPHRIVHRDGVEYWLLGTAHVSRASAEAVRELVANERFDAVAVELDASRAASLMDPDAFAQMDLLKVIREGRAAVIGAGLALGAYQRRLAQQFGIEPGAEMKAAIDGANARGLPHWLIDRDVGITLRRARSAVGFWERTKITAGLIASALDDSEIDEASIEKLKQGDLVAGTFAEFAKSSPQLYERLIRERDAYMAARLREESTRSFGSDTSGRRVLAVVGAGHLEGLAAALEQSPEVPANVLEPLRREPPPSRFGTWFAIALLVLVLAGFAWAFAQGGDVGLEVVLTWIAFTSILGAVGCAAAGAHPLSIGAAALASPLTPLHPALASGMVSGAVETWTRRPRVGDFQDLRQDLVSLRGWWRNRVARVFLVFFLTNLGTAIGIWSFGFWMARFVGKS